MISGHAADSADKYDPLAIAFGSYPYMWNVRLSPDGDKVSFLHMAKVDGGKAVAVVLNLTTNEQSVIISGETGKFELRGCDWANQERLLCSFIGVKHDLGIPFSVTRMVAVNDDGSKVKILLQDKLKKTFTQFQDEIIDRMPDDPDHILVELPSNKGTGVSRVNIYSGKLQTEERVREGTREWISDGRGKVRLRYYVSKTRSRWYYRATGDSSWEILRETMASAGYDDYSPLGFAQNPDELIIIKPHNGRQALWSVNLANDLSEQLIYAHPEVDVNAPFVMGKYGRLVAAAYVTDEQELHYFDKNIEKLHNLILKALPDKSISIYDESWDRRYYLVHVSSDNDPGTYYRLDTETNNLMQLFISHPLLADVKLARVQPVSYTARDSTVVPGYLTLPPGDKQTNLPLIVLPHGGPESRDVLDFSWLLQFLAAEGYAVLQSNYRGSGGYGEAWAGKGAFRSWQLAINDISDGTKWLIEKEVVDPDRICVLGWSYGGYAALMSAIEEPELYKCVVSIAGVTDPLTLIRDSNRYASGSRRTQEFIGTDDEVIDHGSPLKRADEIQAPVLMFHGDNDLNVDVKHSKKMHNALRKADKETGLIIYDDAQHGIEPEDYRIEMLDEIGKFMDTHIGNTASGLDSRNQANKGDNQ